MPEGLEKSLGWDTLILSSSGPKEGFKPPDGLGLRDPKGCPWTWAKRMHTYLRGIHWGSERLLSQRLSRED